MTKRIKDFGDSIEGGRRKRNNRVLNQENKNAIENDGGKDLADTYSLANKIREIGETYCIQEKQKKELYNRKNDFCFPNLLLSAEQDQNICQMADMQMNMILKNWESEAWSLEAPCRMKKLSPL